MIYYLSICDIQLYNISDVYNYFRDVIAIVTSQYLIIKTHN